jgi:hypothetical protein
MSSVPHHQPDTVLFSKEDSLGHMCHVGRIDGISRLVSYRTSACCFSCGHIHGWARIGRERKTDGGTGDVFLISEPYIDHLACLGVERCSGIAHHSRRHVRDQSSRNGCVQSVPFGDWGPARILWCLRKL